MTVTAPIRSRSPRKKMSVRLNGKLVEGRTAKEIFVKAIKEIGVEQVEGLGFTLNGYPLVSQERPPFGRASSAIGNWRVATHCSTDMKHSLLQRIAARLRVDMEVQVVEVEESLRRILGDDCYRILRRD